jgi:hypothetical protein
MSDASGGSEPGANEFHFLLLPWFFFRYIPVNDNGDVDAMLCRQAQSQR